MPWVERCYDSLRNSTYPCDILTIDNGSTDGSGAIIDQFAQKDARIRVIRNEKNVFIAEARNRALAQAKGEYLYLIDSDDWVLPEMLAVMYG